MLDEHIFEAQKDVEQCSRDFENMKFEKDQEVKELVKHLMEVEKEGERLKRDKENRAIEFEKKVVDEKEQI